MATTTFTHRTVLLEPTVDALLPQQWDVHESTIWVDATFGRGGHTQLLLDRLPANAKVIVFDKDPLAIETAQALAQKDPRVTVMHQGFGQIKEALAAEGIYQIHGILMDLGVSSPQIDDASRGFSFMRDGPLDMRMNSSSGITIADWLQNASTDKIKEVIKTYGEERFAFQIAKAITDRRSIRPLTTTGELAELVASTVRTREKGQHPATRTFQALRIYINQELAELAHVLASSLNLLVPNGRLAVISFHSLEDRLVKQFMQACARPGDDSARLPIPEADRPQPLLSDVKRVLPSDDEVDANPRSRSAVLRMATRTQTPLTENDGYSILSRVASLASLDIDGEFSSWLNTKKGQGKRHG